MSKYPEHEKIKKYGDAPQYVSEFLEWLSNAGYSIHRVTYNDEGKTQVERPSITETLNEWMGVDPKKLEKERRQMLSAYQEAERDVEENLD